MNEFGWEKALRDVDVRVARYAWIVEQHLDMNDEDIERLVARDSDGSAVQDFLAGRLAEEQEADSRRERGPNRSGAGDGQNRAHECVVHPMACWALTLADEFRHACEARGRGGDEAGGAAVEACSMGLYGVAAKLAGTLNVWEGDSDPESGYIVASLKRALKRLHDTLGHMETIRASGALDAELLDYLASELYPLREGVLHLMSWHRGGVASE